MSTTLTARHLRRCAAALAAIFAAGSFGPARAERGYPPIADPVVAKECGACHMRYPAGLLPAQSWKAIVDGLQNHFGENASLDPAATQAVLAYLTANAGVERRPWWSSFSKDPAPAGPVLQRITEQSWFRGQHGPRRLSPDRLARRGARSPSNCDACHRGAEAGLFDDD